MMTAGSTQYTAYCATAPVPQVCGTVTLELYDSYGDGWNGNDMDVVTSVAVQPLMVCLLVVSFLTH